MRRRDTLVALGAATVASARAARAAPADTMLADVAA